MGGSDHLSHGPSLSGRAGFCSNSTFSASKVVSFIEAPLYAPFYSLGRLFFSFGRSWILPPRGIRGFSLAVQFPPSSLWDVRDCFPVRGVFFRLKFNGTRVWGFLENCTDVPKTLTPRLALFSGQSSCTHYTIPDAVLPRPIPVARSAPLCRSESAGKLVSPTRPLVRLDGSPASLVDVPEVPGCDGSPATSSTPPACTWHNLKTAKCAAKSGHAERAANVDDLPAKSGPTLPAGNSVHRAVLPMQPECALPATDCGNSSAAANNSDLPTTTCKTWQADKRVDSSAATQANPTSTNAGAADVIFSGSGKNNDALIVGCGQPVVHIKSTKTNCGGPEVMTDDITVRQTNPSLDAVLDSFPVVFRETLGCCKDHVIHNIPFSHSPPPKEFPRSGVSGPAEVSQLWLEIQRMVSRGILKEVDFEPFLLPMFGVAKKVANEIRWVVDFRRLNACIKAQPLWTPSTEFVLTSVSSYEVASVLDLKDAYHQISMSSNVSKYMGVTAYNRYFVYQRMPQGYVNSSFEFIRALRPCMVRAQKRMTSQVLWYLDDICLLSKNTKVHLADLRVLLEELQTAGWVVRKDKCQFMVKEFDFLGVRMTPAGVKPTESIWFKLQSIPAPTDRQGWRQVRGWLVPLRRFIWQGGQVMDVLLKAEKSGKEGDWINFLCLLGKHMIHCHHVTKDVKRFTIAVDSSGQGWGACLINSGKVIQCTSGIWGPKYKHKLSNELELEGLVKALNTFRVFTFGCSISILTDNAAVYSLQNPSNLSDYVKRRIDQLQRDHVEVVFLPGQSNVLPDFLSRYSSVHGVYSGRSSKSMGVMLGAGESFLKPLTEIGWKQCHFGHVGCANTVERAKRYGWDLSYDEAKRRILQCRACCLFRQKPSQKQLGHLRDANQPGEMVSIDVMGPLKRTSTGKRYIITIVDNLTRRCFGKAVTKVSSHSVCHALDTWIQICGSLQNVISDNATYFRSSEFANWCIHNAVHHIWTPPYLHRANGFVERANLEIINRLRRMLVDSGNLSWDALLDDAVWAVNETKCRMTGFFPLDLWDMGPSQWAKANTTRQAIRKKHNEGLKLNKYRNKWTVGDRVWVFDLQRAETLGNKLDPWWIGPGIVMCRISTALWKIQLPGRRIVMHDDFLLPVE